MRVLMCGDREWADADTIRLAVASLPKDTLVIHGNARGADQIAGKAAEAFGLQVHAVPADWKRYGRAAGPLRNRQMLELKPDYVVAFHSDIANSKGTRDCLQEAIRRGIPTTLIADQRGLRVLPWLLASRR